MTDSDRQMDRALAELPTAEPARSVWPRLEQQVARQERKRRLATLLGYATPALAASLVVAVLVFSPPEGEPEPSQSLRKTVENAVKDARPPPAFSNLEMKAGQHRLEALLVSTRPRAVDVAPAVDSRGAGNEVDKPDKKTVDEF